MKKKNAFSNTHAAIILGIPLAVGIFAVVYFTLPSALSVSYTNEPLSALATTSAQGIRPVGAVSSTTLSASTSAPAVTHIATPEVVRAIYMSQCVAGTPSFRDSLVKFIDQSDLNTVVIDIRDYTGRISFPTTNPILKDMVSPDCGAKDMRAFVAKLHSKNIYVIGRITTFQNPYYAKLHPELAVQKVGGGVWHDNKGLAFIDVGAKPYWDTVIELGKVSYNDVGFDELNFDYLRFPSDGPMKEADYSWDKGKSKAQALEEFFQYLSAGLKPTGVKLSADLFGYVTVHTDDLGIGQVLERAMPYFDYIDPMVYPSHYNSGFAGLKNVNSDPYAVVHISLETAVKRAMASTTSVEGMTEEPIMKTVLVPATATVATTTKEVASGLYTKAVYPASVIRPWLQSFNYPVVYTPAMVMAQIKANTDSGLGAYLFWDAGNKYAALRQVLSTTSTTQ